MRRLTSLKRDPWDTIDSVHQSLNAPLKKLRDLVP